MVFAIDQVHKMEIKQHGADVFTDVTSYVLGDSTLNLTTGRRISGGKIVFDSGIKDIIPTLTTQDEIKISVGDSIADTHIFTGLMHDGSDDDETETVTFSMKNYAILTSKRRATEVYREGVSLPSADPIDVVKDLINKYLPELHYDSTSIPDSPAGTEEFKNHRLQNKSLKEEFDFIAEELLGRIWYVDKDKKFWMVVRNFTDTGYTLETKNNILGNLSKAVDVKNFANYIIVDGKVFDVGFQDIFSGDGITTKFTLSKRPFQLTTKIDDDVQAGAITGTDFSDDAEYIIDPDEPSVTFILPPGGSSTITVDAIAKSKIHDEFGDAGSITRYGRHEGEPIVDEGVDTQQKANDIINNQLEIRKVPIEIYIGKTVWNENVLPLKKVTLKDDDRSINQLMNVLETNFRFGERTFEVRFKLNDFNFTTIDLYEQLLNRIRTLEFNQRNAGDEIAKYILFGSDFVTSINNLNIKSGGIGNAFTLDHANTALDDASVFLDGIDGNPGLIDEGEVRVINLDNVFVEDFFNTFYKGISGGSHGGPDWDITLKRLKMNSSSNKAVTYNTFQDIKIFHQNEDDILTVKFETTKNLFENDIVKFLIKPDGINWEEAVENEVYTLQNTGQEAEARIVFIGNGGSDSWISQLKITIGV